MTRTPFIAGNWKMNKTVAEAERYIQALLPQVAAVDGVEIVVCPPFLALGALVDSARGSQVGIYAQNMHEADAGAYTGEVSAAMLSELDVAGVVLGHSERRQYFNETDKALQLKVPEGARDRPDADPLRRRDRGRARARQDRAAAAQPGPGGAREGLGRAAARGRHRLRADLGDRHRQDRDARPGAGGVLVHPRAGRQPRQGRRRAGRVVYGGSCKPDNAAELLALEDVDGALVGGASLDPGDFAAIVEAAAA